PAAGPHRRSTCAPPAHEDRQSLFVRSSHPTPHPAPVTINDRAGDSIPAGAEPRHGGPNRGMAGQTAAWRARTAAWRARTAAWRAEPRPWRAEAVRALHGLW